MYTHAHRLCQVREMSKQHHMEEESEFARDGEKGKAPKMVPAPSCTRTRARTHARTHRCSTWTT
jgi:hypothetical protein